MSRKGLRNDLLYKMREYSGMSQEGRSFHRKLRKNELKTCNQGDKKTQKLSCHNID